jgi:hypothetical protein
MQLSFFEFSEPQRWDFSLANIPRLALLSILFGASGDLHAYLGDDSLELFASKNRYGLSANDSIEDNHAKNTHQQRLLIFCSERQNPADPARADVASTR